MTLNSGLFFACLLFFLPGSTHTKLVEAPSRREYDFIIAGGGTAGSVLASRLSEDCDVSVLVVEAGINNEGVLNVEVPFLASALPGSSVDWNYNGLFGRTVPLPRGFVLGGSSSINFMAWNRCPNDFWDSMAASSSNPIWGWPEIEKYWMKTSTLVQPADGHDGTGKIDPNNYGDGPVQVSLAGFKDELQDRVIGSTKLLGDRFEYTLDVNGGETLGIGYLSSSVGNGTRSSAATAYLQPVIERENLEVVVSTRVTRVFGSKDPLKINSVEISTTPDGPRTTIRAKKEIILSGGVFGTFQILSLSGIGPSDVLTPLGIDVVVDAPAVGANLVDHPLLGNYFSVNSNSTWDIVLRNQTVFEERLNQWLTEKQGQFVDTPSNTIAYFKLPSFLEYDPSTGPGSANTELLFANGFAAFGPIETPSTGSFLTVVSAVLSPTSRGNVTIASTNPWDPPVIDLQMFTTQYDIDAMVQAMKDAQTLLAAQPWTGYILGPFGDLANATTDGELADYARKYSVTVDHALGTAKIGEVVDSELKVIGVSGLRVVDASILHTAPECHPQGVVYTIAERAAKLIKDEYF
ncbi:aryl-alcohol-oxidase from pleurotus Eryingii [Hymenopellis radicata]|nr:aryl-alcohol-oxidase from pleurotus Eryingii [Hymenopellis radicata]